MSGWPFRQTRVRKYCKAELASRFHSQWKYFPPATTWRGRGRVEHMMLGLIPAMYNSLTIRGQHVHTQWPDWRQAPLNLLLNTSHVFPINVNGREGERAREWLRKTQRKTIESKRQREWVREGERMGERDRKERESAQHTNLFPPVGQDKWT